MSTGGEKKPYSIKLVINTKEKKVLYAEAGKNFVDFLFSLLTLPLKTVAKILADEAMPGCLPNLHGSIEILDDIYMEYPVTKNVLLSPEVNPLLQKTLLTIVPPSPPAPPTKFYRCSGGRYNDCRNYITNDPKDNCIYCFATMSIEVTLRAAPSSKILTDKGGKNIKDLVGYVITDDLFVLPITTLSLLKKLDITDTTILEEKDIQVGKTECLDILKASLLSESVLTDAFHATLSS